MPPLSPLVRFRHLTKLSKWLFLCVTVTFEVGNDKNKHTCSLPGWRLKWRTVGTVHRRFANQTHARHGPHLVFGLTRDVHFSCHNPTPQECHRLSSKPVFESVHDPKGKRIIRKAVSHAALAGLFGSFSSCFSSLRQWYEEGNRSGGPGKPLVIRLCGPLWGWHSNGRIVSFQTSVATADNAAGSPILMRRCYNCAVHVSPSIQPFS